MLNRPYHCTFCVIPWNLFILLFPCRRIIVRLVSMAGTGYYYMMTRNRLKPKLEFMKHDPIGKQQFENQMCSQQGKVFVRHSYFSHVTNFMSKLLAPTRHNLWPFGNIYNVKIILLQKKSICNLFTRLFPSEQARVICGTKGQEGQVINAGNIDRQQGNIHKRN